MARGSSFPSLGMTQGSTETGRVSFFWRTERTDRSLGFSGPPGQTKRIQEPSERTQILRQGSASAPEKATDQHRETDQGGWDLQPPLSRPPVPSVGPGNLHWATQLIKKRANQFHKSRVLQVKNRCHKSLHARQQCLGLLTPFPITHRTDSGTLMTIKTTRDGHHPGLNQEVQRHLSWISFKQPFLSDPCRRCHKQTQRIKSFWSSLLEASRSTRAEVGGGSGVHTC